MPRRRRHDNGGDEWRFLGEDEECHLCGNDKLPWRDGIFCVVCDNRDDGTATWFDQFTEHEATGDS